MLIILILTIALCASLTLLVQQASNLSQAGQTGVHISTRQSKDSGGHADSLARTTTERGKVSQNPGSGPPSPESAPPAANPPTLPAGVVNLNSADASQLESVKGIGPVMAKRIVEYRTKIGAFTSVDQLLEVQGIGSKTLDKLKSSLVVQ
ncbi:hypothetical protein KIMH_07230 [Bombiscardovia apis]|uniref:Helix-hairpin-helix DNA-binding motif class 1 domain-containing protein n=2 Tax=Bombiscardovia apis TaxID=2932182 RepID=A0ABM8BCK6_9BIFI|nr:hypothetical protein KIMH_07230 [Bombiscardovia apis]